MKFKAYVTSFAIVLSILGCSQASNKKGHELWRHKMSLDEVREELEDIDSVSVKVVNKPKLAVFIVVDQFGYDYVPTLRNYWKGGFKYLLDNGTLYMNAFHTHARTETCAGHATLATGSPPRKSGIISNEWYSRTLKRELYCVEDPEHKRSPRLMKTSTLGDWLKAQDQDSKVVSASGKDRAAITMGGFNPDAAFWYNKNNGRFTTSGYYAQTLPSTKKTIKQLGKKADSLFGTLWEPNFKNIPQGLRKDFLYLPQGAFKNQFPHSFGELSAVIHKGFYTSIYESPMVDELLGEFAISLLKDYELGKDNHTDIMFVSFSAVDTVGHRYGPNSPEILDTILRLDKVLDKLIKSIFNEVDEEDVIFILSADHGVQRFPEYNSSVGKPGKRISPEDISCIQAAGLKSLEPYSKIIKPTKVFNAQGVYSSKFKKLPPETKKKIETSLIAELEKCSAIKKIWTKENTLSSKNPLQPSYFDNYYPSRSRDLHPQLAKDFLINKSGTTHGTPYRYDSHVPVIFSGANKDADISSDKIGTKDVAKIIADSIGIRSRKN